MLINEISAGAPEISYAWVHWLWLFLASGISAAMVLLHRRNDSKALTRPGVVLAAVAAASMAMLLVGFVNSGSETRRHYQVQDDNFDRLAKEQFGLQFEDMYQTIKLRNEDLVATTVEGERLLVSTSVVGDRMLFFSGGREIPQREPERQM